MKLDDSTAVTFDRYGTIVFSTASPADGVRDEIVGRFGGDIQPGVTLEDWPMEAGDAVNGEVLDPVLGRSRADHRHYRVFRSEADLGGDGHFERVPLAFTTLAGAGGWRVFIETLRKLDEISRIGVEGEPDELMDKAFRAFDSRRPPEYRLFEGIS